MVNYTNLKDGAFENGLPFYKARLQVLLQSLGIANSPCVLLKPPISITDEGGMCLKFSLLLLNYTYVHSKTINKNTLI